MLWFTVFRLVQATGIATATVVTRAMLRDTFGIDDSARYTAYLAGGMGVSTMIAPALSGYLIETSGWRMSFYAMTGLALVVLIWLLSTLPETRQRGIAAENAFRKMRVDFSSLAKSRLFWGYTLIYGFGNAAFFTFLTSAPLYFAEHLSTGPTLFGMYMGSMALAYICGALVGSRVIRMHGFRAYLDAWPVRDFCQRRPHPAHSLVFPCKRFSHHLSIPVPVRIYRAGQPAIPGRRCRASSGQGRKRHQGPPAACPWQSAPCRPCWRHRSMTAPS